MPKLTLKDPGANFRSVQQIKSNNDTIVAAVEKTLSRDGTAPNQMEAVLDMNGYRILNLPEPAFDSDPVRRIDVDSRLIEQIQDDGDAQVARIISEGGAQEARVEAKGDVEFARVQAKGDVEETRVEAKGDVEFARVEAKGDVEFARVEAKGDVEFARVQAKGDVEETRVEAEGNLQFSRIQSEGSVQVALVSAAAAAEFYVSIAAGLAGTVDGEFFIVADDSGPNLILTLYRNDSGTEELFGDVSPPTQDLDPDASPEFAGLTLSTSRDPVVNATLAHVTTDDRIIGYIDRTGREWTTAQGFLQLPQVARDPNPFAWAIVTEGGRLLLGFDDQGGCTIPGLGIVPASGGYTPPSEFSTDYLVGQVRIFDGFKVATRHDGSFSYDVRRNGSAPVAVIQHYEPVLALMVMGQSNAGYGGDAGGPVLTDAVFPTTCFSFASRITSSGGALVPADTLVGVRTLADLTTEVTQLPATMAAFALENSTRAAYDEVTPGVFTWTSWQGGTGIVGFERDTDNWDNLLAGAGRIGPVVLPYGRTVTCPAIVWIQGEADATSTTYQADLEALADDLCPEVETVMDLDAEPKFLVIQTNISDQGSVQSLSRLAQVAAARANARINLAGPSYQCPLVDNIHQSPEGKMILGETIAEAYRTIWREGSFTPLWTLSAVRTGAVIDVTFNLPGGPLQWDTDFVPAVTNYGFQYVDDSSSATISSVNILNANTVRITLNTTPSGANPKVRYGWPIDLTANGFSSGRGQLFSPSTTPSVYAALGFDVPAIVRHYAVSEERDVTT